MLASCIAVVLHEIPLPHRLGYVPKVLPHGLRVIQVSGLNNASRIRQRKTQPPTTSPIVVPPDGARKQLKSNDTRLDIKLGRSWQSWQNLTVRAPEFTSRN